MRMEEQPLGRPGSFRHARKNNRAGQIGSAPVHESLGRARKGSRASRLHEEGQTLGRPGLLAQGRAAAGQTRVNYLIRYIPSRTRNLQNIHSILNCPRTRVFTKTAHYITFSKYPLALPVIVNV